MGRKLKPISPNDKTARPERREKMQEVLIKTDRLEELPDNPPEYLQQFGKRLWHKVVPELKEMGLVKKLDQSNLEIMCTFYDVFRKAYEEVKTNGAYDIESGKKSPAYNAMLDAASHMEKCSRELGLTYTSRSAMITTNTDDSTDTNNTDMADVFKLFSGGRDT